MLEMTMMSLRWWVRSCGSARRDRRCGPAAWTAKSLSTSSGVGQTRENPPLAMPALVIRSDRGRKSASCGEIAAHAACQTDA